MPYITVNAERCKACLLCVEFCPRHCIQMSEGLNGRGFHTAVLAKPELCTGCQACALMCPDVCIEVYRDRKAEEAE